MEEGGGNSFCPLEVGTDMKRHRFIPIIIALVMMITLCSGTVYGAGENCGGLVEKDVFYPEKDDVIQDPALHWAVRAAMQCTGERKKLTKEDVESSYVQYISYEQSAHPENFGDWTMPWYVTSLEGLQYATSAKQIDIGYTANKKGMRIADLTPISGLTQLSQLFLKSDGLDDVSAIQNLTNLTTLDLSGNQIEDLTPLGNMKKLAQLTLSSNRIENLDTLTGLTKLRSLDLSGNAIQTLPKDFNKLSNLTSLDLSDNKNLTDISALSALPSLQRLSLVGDNNITDIHPLAELTALDKENTFLPTNISAKDKDDLFAAIAVNKQIQEFSVSHMTADDLSTVKRALAAYADLSEDQKSYIDSGKIQAIESNKAKVEKGEAPDAYPEYENTGSKTPVFDRLEIKVVNKKGAPLEGIAFTKEKKVEYKEDNETKYVIQKESFTTDEEGILTLKHEMMDATYDSITVYPEDSNLTADPEKITYTVTYGGEGGPTRVTETVNGAKATGLEKLQFVIQEEGNDAARASLGNFVQKVEETVSLQESYRYTPETWKVYEDAFRKAQKMVKEESGTTQQLQVAQEALQQAYEGLRKGEHLTVIKLTVRDESGKHIGRAFKFQIRDPKNPSRAWNEYSDADTGIAYILVSPGWSDGTVWEIRACVQETMDMTPIHVTTAKDGNQWYFKTIDGKDATIDYESMVTLRPRSTDKEEKPEDKPEDKPKETIPLQNVKLSRAAYTYNGKVQKPSLLVTNSKGKKLTSKDYVVSYSGGCKSVGIYTCTVTLRGDYEGKISRSFQILPKGTKVKSVKAGKKKITVKWNRQTSQTTGYQIQYGKDKKFRKGIKTVTIGKNKTTTKTIKKLSRKKNYYVRVRTYRNVKVGKKVVKVVSSWSSAKKIKVK